MKTKFLCVCEGGNVRSTTLAYALKDWHGQEALACGTDCNSFFTLNMLGNWADVILVPSRRVWDKFPPGYEEKMVEVTIGHDVWQTPWHPDLMELCLRIAENEVLRRA
jgi:predicted protein tyrosine phosphatase